MQRPNRSSLLSDTNESDAGGATNDLNLSTIMTKAKQNVVNGYDLRQLVDTVTKDIKTKYRKSIIRRAVHPTLICSTPFPTQSADNNDRFLNSTISSFHSDCTNQNHDIPRDNEENGNVLSNIISQERESTSKLNVDEINGHKQIQLSYRDGEKERGDEYIGPSVNKETCNMVTEMNEENLISSYENKEKNKSLKSSNMKALNKSLASLTKMKESKENTDDNGQAVNSEFSSKMNMIDLVTPHQSTSKYKYKKSIDSHPLSVYDDDSYVSRIWKKKKKIKDKVEDTSVSKSQDFSLSCIDNRKIQHNLQKLDKDTARNRPKSIARLNTSKIKYKYITDDSEDESDIEFDEVRKKRKCSVAIPIKRRNTSSSRKYKLKSHKNTKYMVVDDEDERKNLRGKNREVVRRKSRFIEVSDSDVRTRRHKSSARPARGRYFRRISSSSDLLEETTPESDPDSYRYYEKSFPREQSEPRREKKIRLKSVDSYKCDRYRSEDSPKIKYPYQKQNEKMNRLSRRDSYDLVNKRNKVRAEKGKEYVSQPNKGESGQMEKKVLQFLSNLINNAMVNDPESSREQDNVLSAGQEFVENVISSNSGNSTDLNTNLRELTHKFRAPSKFSNRLDLRRSHNKIHLKKLARSPYIISDFQTVIPPGINGIKRSPKKRLHDIVKRLSANARKARTTMNIAVQTSLNRPGSLSPKTNRASPLNSVQLEKNNPKDTDSNSILDDVLDSESNSRRTKQNVIILQNVTIRKNHDQNESIRDDSRCERKIVGRSPESEMEQSVNEYTEESSRIISDLKERKSTKNETIEDSVQMVDLEEYKNESIQYHPRSSILVNEKSSRKLSKNETKNSIKMVDSQQNKNESLKDDSRSPTVVNKKPTSRKSSKNEAIETSMQTVVLEEYKNKSIQDNPRSPTSVNKRQCRKLSENETKNSIKMVDSQQNKNESLKDDSRSTTVVNKKPTSRKSSKNEAIENLVQTVDLEEYKNESIQYHPRSLTSVNKKQCRNESFEDNLRNPIEVDKTPESQKLSKNESMNSSIHKVDSQQNKNESLEDDSRSPTALNKRPTSRKSSKNETIQNSSGTVELERNKTEYVRDRSKTPNSKNKKRRIDESLDNKRTQETKQTLNSPPKEKVQNEGDTKDGSIFEAETRTKGDSPNVFALPVRPPRRKKRNLPSTKLIYPDSDTETPKSDSGIANIMNSRNDTEDDATTKNCDFTPSDSLSSTRRNTSPRTPKRNSANVSQKNELSKNCTLQTPNKIIKMTEKDSCDNQGFKKPKERPKRRANVEEIKASPKRTREISENRDQNDEIAGSISRKNSRSRKNTFPDDSLFATRKSSRKKKPVQSVWEILASADLPKKSVKEDKNSKITNTRGEIMSESKNRAKTVGKDTEKVKTKASSNKTRAKLKKNKTSDSTNNSDILTQDIVPLNSQNEFCSSETNISNTRTHSDAPDKDGNNETDMMPDCNNAIDPSSLRETMIEKKKPNRKIKRRKPLLRPPDSKKKVKNTADAKSRHRDAKPTENKAEHSENMEIESQSENPKKPPKKATKPKKSPKKRKTKDETELKNEISLCVLDIIPDQSKFFELVNQLDKDKNHFYQFTKTSNMLALAPKNIKRFINSDYEQVYVRVQGSSSLKIGNLYVAQSPPIFVIPKGVCAEIENTGSTLVIFIIQVT